MRLFCIYIISYFFIKVNLIRKPGSVYNSHLSCLIITHKFYATTMKQIGPIYRFVLVLLQIKFTSNLCYHKSSALLPHFFTLAVKTFTSVRRYISVALVRRSPWVDVIHYLVLWSPDFPHILRDCSIKLLVRQEGLKPPTDRVEAGCSIQLSYWRILRNIFIFLIYFVYILYHIFL